MHFRALALRLNARVSELTLAAECARTDAESARAELHRVRSRHDTNTQALEKRQKQLISALKAVGGQAQPLALAGSSETSDAGPAQPLSQAGSGALEGTSDGLMAVRDRNQSQAVQEAELAVAVMQVTSPTNYMAAGVWKTFTASGTRECTYSCFQDMLQAVTRTVSAYTCTAGMHQRLSCKHCSCACHSCFNPNEQ